MADGTDISKLKSVGQVKRTARRPSGSCAVSYYSSRLRSFEIQYRYLTDSPELPGTAPARSPMSAGWGEPPERRNRARTLKEPTRPSSTTASLILVETSP